MTTNIVSSIAPPLPAPTRLGAPDTPADHRTGSARLALLTAVDTATPIRLPRAIDPTLLPEAAASRHEEVLEMMHKVFPDVHRAAKATIEKRLKEDYGLTLNADQTYYNDFNTNVESNAIDRDLGNGNFDRAPTQSITLTDLLLRVATGKRAPVAADAIIANTGIYTEGAWSSSFGDHNKVALSAGQFLHAAQETHFFHDYGTLLREYWNEHFDTIQTLVEIRALDYVEKHRRAGNRARALGVSPKLDLSDEALAMVAEATGRRDPDFAPLGTRVYRFDINGYVSKDILWMRDTSGRIVLVIPDDPHPLREFRDFNAMRAGIRDILRTTQGRAAIAAHFAAADRPTHWYSSYDGVDKWLVTLNEDSARDYDYAIARTETRMHGPLQIGLPDEYGSRLLSDKALSMLSEAAGVTVAPPFKPQQTKAHLFDINGLPAVDMLWLKAADGHVVLIMPGNDVPVREYANVASMRAALLAMAMTPEGRDELASHFSPERRRSDTTRAGVDQWLRDIADHPSRYQQRLVYDPSRHQVGGAGANVFQVQQLRIRELQLNLVDLLARAQWETVLERDQWIKTLSLPYQPFYGARPTDDTCDAVLTQFPRSDALSRSRRALGNNASEVCMTPRQHVRAWGESLTRRLSGAADRLRSGMLQSDAEAPETSGTPEPQYHGIDLAAAIAGGVASAPVTSLTSHASLPRGRNVNPLGFLETSNLPTLYVAWPVRPVSELAMNWLLVSSRHGAPMPNQSDRRLPELHGFPAQGGFAAGRRAINGSVIDAWLTPEAARRAAEARYGNEGQHAAMYVISPGQLTGVSFAENRIHNPDFNRLMSDGNSSIDHLVQVGDYRMGYAQSPYVALSDFMVQLRMDEHMAPRIERLQE